MEFEILNWIQTLHNPVLDRVMIFITSLGNVGWFWVAAALLLVCIKRYRKYGVCMLLALLLGFLTGNVLLKNIIMRDRPNWIYQDIVLLIKNPADFSFPSGHSQASFAGAVSLLYMNKRLGAAALCLAAAIAFSRLYFYVHFPTDVLAGVLLGILWAVLAHIIIERLEKRNAAGNSI